MLIGHHKQWQFIKSLVSADILPHAFLFSGQNELGKNKFSLEFAKLLQCAEGKLELRPCGVCRACKDTEKGFHPDVDFIDSAGKEIQIARIRKLNKDLFLKPAFGRIRVGIINEAHQMTNGAQNALLKTLEEPKGKVILVLVSSRPEMLLPTVRSRVSQIKFFPVSREELEKGLLAFEASSAKLKKIAELSFGKPGRAIRFISDDLRLQDEEKTSKEFEALLRSSLALRFRYAKKITAEPDRDLHKIIEVWLRCLRKAAFSRIFRDNGRGKETVPAKLTGLIRRLQEIDYIMATTTVNTRLAIETFFLEL